MFSNTLHLSFSLNVRDQVSHPHKIAILHILIFVFRQRNGNIYCIYFSYAYGNSMFHNITVTIPCCIAGPIVPDKSAKNRLQALFTLLKTEPLTKRCPLIWRLYLWFLYDHGTELTRKTAFYRAVEECPWVKVSVMATGLCQICLFYFYNQNIKTN
jgi:hypothetical protein